jgi:heme/copper-type cytochrome/quinol oxidase subunit 2
MPNMKNIQRSLSQPINKTFAAILIGVVAIALPIYWMYGSDWKEAKLNALTILLPLFWVVIVVGFILLALGKKGKEVTTVETDQKISNAYKYYQKKLNPLWWTAGIVWAIWIGYLAWTLITKA